jgi:SAM-dependent methyltransferase
MYQPQEQQLNIRERIAPHPRDRFYLVLSDLNNFLQRFRTTETIRLLDYGAGASPYRSLFPNAEYLRADYIERPNIDYQVPANSTLPVDSESFDIVLSTQVAEHLLNPNNYFREAHRVLKPGGMLLLTTHGVWEDHGIPYDFQRWTSDGLRRDLVQVGFRVKEVFKLTTSHRCYCFLLFDWLCSASCHTNSIVARAVIKCVRAAVTTIRPLLFVGVDHIWPHCRIVGPLELDSHRLYSIIAAVAVKPKQGSNVEQ